MAEIVYCIPTRNNSRDIHLILEFLKQCTFQAETFKRCLYLTELDDEDRAIAAGLRPIDIAAWSCGSKVPDNEGFSHLMAVASIVLAHDAITAAMAAIVRTGEPAPFDPDHVEIAIPPNLSPDVRQMLSRAARLALIDEWNETRPR